MSKFIILKIDNSKGKSIKSESWKDPGASLYDQLLNAMYTPNDVVDHPDALYTKDYLEECYLIAPINKIKNSPYGVTPYSRSGCKYPHHTIKDGCLVIHEGGLKAAYSRAQQMGIFKGEVKEHLERHYKELGLYEGSNMSINEKIEDNFGHIEDFIIESHSSFEFEGAFLTKTKELVKKGIKKLANVIPKRYLKNLQLMDRPQIRDKIVHIRNSQIFNISESLDIMIESISEDDAISTINDFERLFGKEFGFKIYSDETINGPMIFDNKLRAILINPRYMNRLTSSKELLILMLKHEAGHAIDYSENPPTMDDWIDYNMRRDMIYELRGEYDSGYYNGITLKEIEPAIDASYHHLSFEKRANDAARLDFRELIKMDRGSYPPSNWKSNPAYRIVTMNIPKEILPIYIKKSEEMSKDERIKWIEFWIGAYKQYLSKESLDVIIPKFEKSLKKYKEDYSEFRENEDIKNNDVMDYIIETKSHEHQKVYIGLTIHQSKLKEYHFPKEIQTTGVALNTSLEGLIQYIKDNPKLLDEVKYYTIVDSSELNVLRFITHGDEDDKYDTVYVKIPFTVKINNIHKIPEKAFTEAEEFKNEIKYPTKPGDIIPKSETIIERKKKERKEKIEALLKKFKRENINERGDRIMQKDDLSWIEGFILEEGESDPPLLEDEASSGNDPDKPQNQSEQPKEEKDIEEKKSLPKQTDEKEQPKNGVRRKKLYIAFIEWAKEYNPKNTFGSVFDQDAFTTVYPFVPNEMRYFYRLANPMLCVLAGDLTFFALAELRKVNNQNSRLREMMIFAATPTDVRVFNTKDKKVYRGEEKNGMLQLGDILGDTFDTYLQKMIDEGDILNAPLE